jgi:hypothetical protein
VVVVVVVVVVVIIIIIIIITTTVMKQRLVSYPYAHHEDMWGSEGIIPLILNLGTGRR